MPIALSHDANHDALDLHLIRVDEERLHRRIRGLETDAPVLPVDLLEGDIAAADQRDDHFAVIGGLAVLDDHEVAVADLLVDHRVASTRST